MVSLAVVVAKQRGRPAARVSREQCFRVRWHLDRPTVGSWCRGISQAKSGGASYLPCPDSHVYLAWLKPLMSGQVAAYAGALAASNSLPSENFYHRRLP